MHFFWSVNACFCCVRLSYFRIQPRDWLGETSRKWSIVCRVVRKTKTRSVSEVVCVTAVITCCRWHGGGDVGGEAGGRRYWRSGLGVLKNREQSVMSRRCIITRDVTEPAKIRFRRIRILCFRSIGFGCGYGFATWSQLVLLNSYLSMSVYAKHRTGRHIAVPFSI